METDNPHILVFIQEKNPTTLYMVCMDMPSILYSFASQPPVIHHITDKKEEESETLDLSAAAHRSLRSFPRE